MQAEEILLRDAFLLGIELKIFWLIALLYTICFLLGLAYLITSRLSIGRQMTQ